MDIRKYESIPKIIILGKDIAIKFDSCRYWTFNVLLHLSTHLFLKTYIIFIIGIDALSDRPSILRSKRFYLCALIYHTFKKLLIFRYFPDMLFLHKKTERLIDAPPSEIVYGFIRVSLLLFYPCTGIRMSWP